MKKKLLLITLLLHSYCLVSAQQISLDTAGRLYQVKLNTNSADSFTVKVNSRLKGASLREQTKAFFLEKISATIKPLEDPNATLPRYYGNVEASNIAHDLRAIEAWLENGTIPHGFNYLQPFYNQLNMLLSKGNDEDWYQLNGRPIKDNIRLYPANLDTYTDAYVIELRLNQLFNNFAINLFDSTYSLPDNQLQKLSQKAYIAAEDSLNNLLEKAIHLTKDVNDLTKQDYTDIEQLTADMNKNPVINTIQNSRYIRNWIWLRKGEPVINPFEIKAKDTAASPPKDPLPRSANVSLVAQTKIPSELVNRILLSKGHRKTIRNIHFFRLPDNTVKDQTAEIDQPVRGDENIRVNMHNTLHDEKLILQVVKKTAHSGRNSLVDSISSGLGILADAYALFNPATAWLTTIVGQASHNKSTNDIRFAETHTFGPEVTDTATVQKALAAYLAAAGMLNQSIFKQIQEQVHPQMKNGEVINISVYIALFQREYKKMYDNYSKKLTELSRDSLILSFTSTMVAESNLPPQAMHMNNTGNTTPFYKTVILETGKANEDVTTEYAVKNIVKKGTEPDSITVASFTVKTANLKRMMASAGLMFTKSLSTYGQNSFTPGTATTGANITTSAKTTSFVVGLNVYFVPINMLDEHWIHSKECPAWSRLSLFIGLDIPDIMDHFYPGISFDLNPGIKLTGGTHLYRHKKYNIANNTIKKEANVLELAGPFIGLNIDTDAVLKAINIFKK